MTIELTPEQEAVLEETRRLDSLVEFQIVLNRAMPEIDRVVREVFEPDYISSSL